MRRLGVLAAAVAVLSLPVAAASAGDATLPSTCFNQVSRPSRVVFACADGNFYARDLKWSRWARPRASARGTAIANTCDPTCVGGEFKAYPVRVTAYRLRACRGARPQYTRVRLRFPRRAPGRVAHVWQFPCPRMSTTQPPPAR